MWNGFGIAARLFGLLRIIGGIKFYLIMLCLSFDVVYRRHARLFVPAMLNVRGLDSEFLEQCRQSDCDSRMAFQWNFNC